MYNVLEPGHGGHGGRLSLPLRSPADGHIGRLLELDGLHAPAHLHLKAGMDAVQIRAATDVAGSRIV